MTQTLVVGEAIDDIARALSQFEVTSRSDGMVHFKVELEREDALPFRRALLRIESELMQQEADELTTDSPDEHRTDEQRRADALSELIIRYADARGSG